MYSISKSKFGVELEVGIDSVDFSEIAREEKFIRKGWKFHYEHCGTEIVSPILRGYNGLREIRKQLKALYGIYNEHTRQSFDDCGLHVHVDVSNYNLFDLKRLIIFTNRFSNAIFSLTQKNRKDNHFCIPHEVTEEVLTDLCSFNQIIKELQTDDDGELDRYYALNLLAFKRHNTVEFRFMSGTTDWRMIYCYVVLFAKMVEFARGREDIPIWDMANNREGLSIICKALKINSITKRLLFSINTYFANLYGDYVENYSKFPTKLKIGV